MFSCVHKVFALYFKANTRREIRINSHKTAQMSKKENG